MSRSRRNFSTEFKTNLVLQLLKGASCITKNVDVEN